MAESSARVRLVVSMPYNGEPVVPFHLGLIGDHVDEVILTESRITHSGREKVRWHCDQLAPNPKVTILRIESFSPPPVEWLNRPRLHFMKPGTESAWFRENYQRDFARRHILERYANEEFVAVFCDADEIVAPHVLRELPKLHEQFSYPAHLEMLFFYYNFRWIKEEMWAYAFAANEQALAKWTPSQMRNELKHQTRIHQAGWHLSYFTSIDGLIDKLESFAHQEFNADELKGRDRVRACIHGGNDICGRGGEHDLKPVNLADERTRRSLPQGFELLQRELESMQG